MTLVSSVPEPESWVLTLAGLAVVGGVAAKGRKGKAKAKSLATV